MRDTRSLVCTVVVIVLRAPAEYKPNPQNQQGLKSKGQHEKWLVAATADCQQLLTEVRNCVVMHLAKLVYTGQSEFGYSIMQSRSLFQRESGELGVFLYEHSPISFIQFLSGLAEALTVPVYIIIIRMHCSRSNRWNSIQAPINLRPRRDKARLSRVHPVPLFHRRDRHAISRLNDPLGGPAGGSFGAFCSPYPSSATSCCSSCSLGSQRSSSQVRED
jgi:hypothetical protein